jgi:TonB family protein
LSPPRPITELPRKIKLPTPPQLPQPEIVHLKPAAVPAIPAAPAKSVVAAPQPKVGLFASSKAPAVANNRSQSAVKSGGFGDPSGVTPNPNAARPATIAAVGSFNNTPGFTQGAGSSQAGRRTVASAGFGDGVAGGTPGGVGAGQGTVATGGFGSNVIGGSVTPRAVPRQPSFTPPQVLSEPHPQYTQEARQLRIQGEVTLQVCFGMDGKVQVLRIVSGLGHGLDEAATLVAEQIQFKPATKDGQPTNHITMIHILFQLA